MYTRIRLNKLLLVEGDHDKIFFEKLLEYLQISDIQVEQVGGKPNFGPIINLLVSDDRFHELETLAIIRDADNNPNGAFQSLKGALERANINAPSRPLDITSSMPKASIFILPDNLNEGELETLCINAVSSEPIYSCVDDYFDCIKNVTKQSHPNVAKAKIQAYLASKPDGSIHFARAAQKGYWPWGNDAFQEITNFLLQL